MPGRKKIRRNIVLGVVGIILLIILLSTVSIAWFFFPTTQSISIKTDEYLDILTEIYDYDEQTGQFIRYTNEESIAYKNPAEEQIIDTLTADAITAEATFVEWGNEYFPVEQLEKYYLLIFTYPESNFLDGYVRADITVRMFSGMKNEQDANPKIPYTLVSYAIADTDTDPQDTTLDTARNASYSGNQLFASAGDPETGMRADYMKTSYFSIDMRPVGQQTQSAYIYEDPVSGEKWTRVAVFVKIVSDASNIKDAIFDEGISTGVIQIDTANIYTFSCNFRSLPYHGGVIHD